MRRSFRRGRNPTLKQGIASLGIFILAGCASNVQPLVAQFGEAVTTGVSADNALFDAVDQRKADAQSICLLSNASVDIGSDPKIAASYLKIVPTGIDCQPAGDPGGNKEIPPDVRAGIQAVLSAVQAYGKALQALSGDAAATTLNTNVDSLGKSLTQFDTSVLTPLGVKGFLTPAQLNGVGQAVKDIGGDLVDYAISKDVQSAAQRARQPLRTIVGALVSIDANWTNSIPTNLTNEISPFVIVLWQKGSFSDRQALTAFWNKASTPITPGAADAALNSLVTANDKIADAGPDLSIAEIESAWQAANDAYAAYKSLAGN